DRRDAPARGLVSVLVARVHVRPEEVALLVDEELRLLALLELEVEMLGEGLPETVEAALDEVQRPGIDLGEPCFSVRAVDLVLALVLHGCLDLLRLVHRVADAAAGVLVEEIGRDVEAEAGEEARIHQTSMVRPSLASWTPSGIGSSPGLCVRRIGPSAAASASSAER